MVYSAPHVGSGSIVLTTLVKWQSVMMEHAGSSGSEQGNSVSQKCFKQFPSEEEYFHCLDG